MKYYYTNIIYVAMKHKIKLVNKIYFNNSLKNMYKQTSMYFGYMTYITVYYGYLLLTTQ